MRDVWMYSALCGGILGASLSLSAANLSTPGWGVFELPVLAVPENSRVNLSGLNREAAGTHGFIRVKDGHFVDDRGIPVRFYGTNIAGRSCFPAEDDSKLLAKRLRQLGMNCVRLHMLDDDHPYHLGWMIWENPATMKFSEKNLRRLDALIAACAAEGIYVNLNLHCSWKYTRPWSELAPLGKRVGYWYPEFKELQKKYALTLLNRINTVRGLRYADDPAIVLAPFKPGRVIFLSLNPAPGGRYEIFSAGGSMLYTPNDNRQNYVVSGWFRPDQALPEFLEAYSRAGGMHHAALIYADGDTADTVAALARLMESRGARNG